MNGGAHMNSSSTSKSKKTTSKASTKTTQNKEANMKYEIANELGVNLGPDATARQNGSVGGEMTKRLVSMAKSKQNSN